MKKKLVIIILVLVLLVSMSMPALAASLDSVIATLNSLAAQRPLTAPHVANAVTWLRANPGRIAGNEAAIIGHINAAMAVAPGRPAANLTLNDLTTITGHINRGAALANLRVNVNTNALSAAIAAGTLNAGAITNAVTVIDNVTGQPIGSTAGNWPIRQTGFVADYSVLIVVTTMLTVLFGAATITSLKLKRGVEE